MNEYMLDMVGMDVVGRRERRQALPQAFERQPVVCVDAGHA